MKEILKRWQRELTSLKRRLQARLINSLVIASFSTIGTTEALSELSNNALLFAWCLIALLYIIAFLLFVIALVLIGGI